MPSPEELLVTLQASGLDLCDICPINGAMGSLSSIGIPGSPEPIPTITGINYEGRDPAATSEHELDIAYKNPILKHRRNFLEALREAGIIPIQPSQNRGAEEVDRIFREAGLLDRYKLRQEMGITGGLGILFTESSDRMPEERGPITGVNYEARDPLTEPEIHNSPTFIKSRGMFPLKETGQPGRDIWSKPEEHDSPQPEPAQSTGDTGISRDPKKE